MDRKGCGRGEEKKEKEEEEEEEEESFDLPARLAAFACWPARKTYHVR